jgi:outer membrane biosynthesis protein TonB
MRASHTHLRFAVASLSLVLLAASTGLGQQPWPKDVEGCGDTSKLLRKPNGKVAWFSPKQMKSMSINRATPVFPKSCRCQGQVFIAVVVDTEGKVVCTHVISGHPLLASPSMEAASKWTFKPMTKRGVNVSFVGLLAITFHSAGAVTY